MVVPIVPEESGNTKQIPPSKLWLFTLNSYVPDDIEFLSSNLSKFADKWVFQEETGEQGTPHLQGFVCFNKKLRPLSLKWNNKIHWEKKSKNSTIEQCIAYCSKDDTRTGKTYCHGFKIPKPIKIISNLYDWQQDIVDIISEEPDDRTIHWIWESEGNRGKSALVKYLVVKHDAIVCTGKASDMKYMIKSFIENKHYSPELIIMDIPRTREQYISYEGIEELKNGVFASTKYESGMVVMNSPHVIIFANFEPNRELLSEDRWNVINI